MKSLTLSLLLAMASLTAWAQAGMYRTYQAYLEDEISKEYAEYVGTDHAFSNFKVTFKTESGREVEIKIKKGEYWGYKTEEGLVYKINRRGHPFMMIERGAINVYTNFRSHFDEDGHLVVEYGGSFSPAISKGDNGKMILFSKGKLKKLVKDLGDKEDLKALRKTERGFNSLLSYVEQFNKKYRKEED